MKTIQAFALPVAPLPSTVASDPASRHAPLPDGFVDEDAIAHLLFPAQTERLAPSFGDLALSADEGDFAGWAIPSVSPFREIAEKQELEKALELPETEPGIGVPHRGGHRWWIAAVAGTSAALIMSGFFTTRSQRSDSSGEFFNWLSTPLKRLQASLGSLAP